MSGKAKEKCPKCGCITNPVDTLECTHCGVVFSKYLEKKKKNLLMTCKVCQKKISKNATSCPHCGEIYSAPSPSRNHTKKNYKKKKWAQTYKGKMTTSGIQMTMGFCMILFQLFMIDQFPRQHSLSNFSTRMLILLGAMLILVGAIRMVANIVRGR